MKRFSYLALGLFLVVLFSFCSAEWLSANYLYRTGFTITARQDLNAGFPVDINGTAFDYGAKVEAGKMQTDNDDIRIECGSVELPHHFEDDNSTDFNATWFILPEDLAGGSSIDCNIYYGYDEDVYADSSDFNYFATDSETYAYYRFEEVAGTTLFDYSGNNWDGDLNGVDASNFSSGSERFNGGFTFNGARHIDLPIDLNTLAEGSVSFWVDLDTASGDNSGYVFGSASTVDQISVIVEADGTPLWRFKTQNTLAGQHEWEFDTGYIYTDNAWYHFMLTWGPAGVQMYVNGALDATDSSTASPIDTGYSCFISTINLTNGPDNYYKGTIDEFRISNSQKSMPYKTFYNGNQRFALEVEETSAEESPGIVVANFEYDLEQETVGGKVIVEIDLNDISNYGGEVPTSREWYLNGTLVTNDENATVDVNAAGSYDFTLRAIGDSTTDDENKTISIDGGHLQIHFVDENTWLPVSPDATVNGAVQAVVSGLLDFDLNNQDTADYTVLVSDATHSERGWFWEDLNQFDEIDINAMLLLTTGGVSTEFKFYEFDQTTLLASTRIALMHIDDNFSSIIKTDASAEATFFLNNQDRNYFFTVYDTNGEDYNYNQIIVDFEIPKDEDSLANVSPYGLDVSGAGAKSFPYNTAARDVWMLPNTKGYYNLDVNCTALYYDREVQVQYKGAPSSASVQVYCPASATGIESVFYTKDSTDFSTVTDILIEVYKDIAGEGTVLVQSAVTDAAGTATLSFVEGDEYTLYFYDADGVFLFQKVLRPAFATYYVYIDTGQISWSAPSLEYILILGLPGSGNLEYTVSGYDINVTIDVNNGTIATSWLTIVNNDGNVTFNNACGAGCGHTIREEDLNLTGYITVTVFVETATGLRLSKIVQLIPVSSTVDNLVQTLQSAAFREEWGCSANPNEPCFFLLMISAFLIIAVVVAAGSAVTTDTSALGIIVIAAMAMFQYLTWIPIGFFILASLAVFAGMVISRRLY